MSAIIFTLAEHKKKAQFVTRNLISVKATKRKKGTLHTTAIFYLLEVEKENLAMEMIILKRAFFHCYTCGGGVMIK